MDINLIQKLLEAEAETILQKSVEIPFNPTDISMCPHGAKTKSIVISPLKAGTLFRLKPYINKIALEDLEKMATNSDRKFAPEAPELFGKYAETVLDIIWIALHNNRTEPRKWYREFLQENCTWEDLHIILNAILYRMGTSAFYKSTIALKSMGLLNESEIKATQKNLKSWEREHLRVQSQ